jgi:hypothetical protein
VRNRRSDDSLLWPGVGAFVLGFLLSLGLARACSAQSPTPADGTTVVLVAAVAGVGIGFVDRDAGGYRDSLFPHSDKQAHFLGSVVAARALSDKFGRKWGFLACVAIGAGIEAGQSRNGGYASWRDGVYDVGGCTAGALWSRWAK